jgi:hemoglobin-like flavoprotein
MLELVGDDASGVGYLLKDRVRDVAEFVDAVERVAGGGTATMSLDLEALETSFDLIAERGDELVDTFYSRLFAAAPAVRPLFPQDMRQQKTMLLAALVLLRKSLRDLDAIVPTLLKLGARPEHYPLVGATLIASMAAIAQESWRPEYEAAWNAAFEVVASTMIAGAEEAELAAVA